jgi:hypothetical protein
MTDASLEPPYDVRLRVDLYLDAVRKAQQAAGAPADEAAGIRDDLRAQIYDMLAARAAGRALTVKDADAVLAKLEPPEAYGPSGEGGAAAPRAQAPAVAGSSPAAQAAPLPAGPPKPKFSRTALIGLLGFLPIFGFCVLGVPAAYLGFHVLDVPAVPPVGSPGEPIPMYAKSWVFICFAIIPLMGVLWTTICGIAAIVQIRRAAGQITGLWLAVFDAVVFPIIVFVVLVAGVLVCG